MNHGNYVLIGMPEDNIKIKGEKMEQNGNTENVFVKTSDLYFAAFLQCMGCKIVKTEKENSKCIFTFEDLQKRDNLKDIYFNDSDESKIACLKYANAIRSLKTFCYIRN